MLLPVKNTWKPLKYGDRWRKTIYGLYKIECQNKQMKKTYSGHNAILINIFY